LGLWILEFIGKGLWEILEIGEEMFWKMFGIDIGLCPTSPILYKI
jgi:hypothetical protein